MLRSALGGVLAVALVSGGILGLQWLVPPERDSPAVVASPPPGEVPVTRAPTTTTPSTRPPSPGADRPTPIPRPAITVLNNSRINGLAAEAAHDFATHGWKISGTGNLGGRLAVTTVYYGPGQRDDAEVLRKGFPAIKAMAPRYAGLPGEGGLTVVVTRDYPH